MVARPRARRRLYGPVNMANAAIAIQAAARGFLARRRAARMANRRLLSPMDIKRKFSKAKRPQGQVTVPKVFPKARIGSLIGTVKSKRSVKYKKIDPLEIKTHIDINSAVDQSQVAYFGFADAGYQDDQLMQGCMALTNMFFRRSGLKLPDTNLTMAQAASTPADAAPWYFRPKLRRIEILFANVDQEGSTTFSSVDIDVNQDSTINSVASVIKAEIVALNTSPQVHNKWPIIAKLFSRDVTSNTVENLFATYDLENVMVDFAYMRKYKWINVTPAGEGGVGGNTNINDINANPLSGRIYKFKGPTPLVRAQIKDYNGLLALDGFNQIEEQGADSSSALACNTFRLGNSYATLPKDEFRQPFKAVQFFKNCETEDKVYMPPGGYKQLIRSGKVTMNFKRFVQATYKKDGTSQMVADGIQRPPKIGTCTLWALEPALRTDVNEQVSLRVNVETWYTTKTRVADKKQPVATRIEVTAGPTFGP